MSERAVVSVEGLSHAYGKHLALDKLTLSAEAGEILGILGPNGSGKTTLFRILSTLIPTEPGHAKILGRDVSRERDFVRQNIGVVFQSPSLDTQLSAEENLVCQGHLYGLNGADLKTRVADSLASVSMSEHSHKRVGTFSGGMRRRIEVAKGLLHRPKILLMDEPSTGIDPAARIEMWRHLQSINKAGVTVLLTTHLMEEAERCTRLAVMARGKLLACDTPTALKQRIGGDVIALTTSDPTALQNSLREKLDVETNQLDGVVRLERDRGHEWVPKIVEAALGLVDSISVGKPTLEDVFVHLTGQRFAADEKDERPLTTSVGQSELQSHRS